MPVRGNLYAQYGPNSRMGQRGADQTIEFSSGITEIAASLWPGVTRRLHVGLAALLAVAGLLGSGALIAAGLVVRLLLAVWSAAVGRRRW